MTPGARTQAAIELLNNILTSWQSEKRIPADKLIENYFKSHRYIGSKDRAAVGELVYWVLRHKASLEWWIARHKHLLDPAAMVFAALILRRDYTVDSLHSITKDSKYSPHSLMDDEIKFLSALEGKGIFHPEMPQYVALNYPEWMHSILYERFGEQLETEMRALNEQAPTDLRVNTLKTNREQLQDDLAKETFETKPTSLSPVGLRMNKRAPVFTSKQFKEGHFEVQDEGSQMVAFLTDTKPGMRVIDFCAGAGGKTLAMAASMQNKGRILAWDTSEKRLKQLAPRLKRAGVDNVQSHVIASENDAFIKRHKGTADRVLLDAPCSGSGTWRRNPDLKWRFTQNDLDEIVAIQQSILQSAARLVKPGGRLIYATCSVLKIENEKQIDQFLKSVNNFRVVNVKKMWDKTLPEKIGEDADFFQVTPHQDGVDGFFAAVLEKLPGEPNNKTPSGHRD